MELNRLLLVFTLCLISRTLAFEPKKLSQPLQKDILPLKSEEPVPIPSETKIRQADGEEDEYVDAKLSPPYLMSSGVEKDTNGSESEEEDSACLQPKKPGPCKARKKRFYFNSAKKTCDEFSYGGCQKNDNNFKSLEECINKCIGN